MRGTKDHGQRDNHGNVQNQKRYVQPRGDMKPVTTKARGSKIISQKESYDKITLKMLNFILQRDTLPLLISFLNVRMLLVTISVVLPC